ncbi:CDP-glycerol--poly(glycerophosphate) glycerophosphotransferase [Marinomonas rhizomae]|uniref:CDP-glycerol:poly(Glycerophosphate) glycerophosphotransferase n=1 Tax=Marinomonas rhizomae TaxID=491948 RepID=A0A366J5Q6_9GAMM|nr:CDP-glycerol glycerophosphotransferase family protein [Marinomonas rhizomae]RBP81740.1 CDP-glycerol:poly(glycerophosphate) glycerophosphotransferase [Marinomonas rhizomae]RNF72868.1 CDP-glycerol--poly(glycerophosphate) glycerophosphotransferase [Marinomonas rhizomae]
MKVIFDTKSLYYLPQYLPVNKELNGIDVSTIFVFYEGIHDPIIKQLALDSDLSSIWVKNEEEAIDFYEKEQADWVFFANSFPYLDRLHQVSRSAQLGHGIGPKASYYTKSSRSMSVRFVEGDYRKKRLEKMFPDDEFVDVGFCKMDPILNGELSKDDLLKRYGLNKQRLTILYAPTFYPSSIEKFPKDWPADFQDYNVIIKPHYFSISKKQYSKQLSLLNRWSEFENVYLAKTEDYSLLPFLEVADVLVSDASSALFEFAILNKPVIWCDFLKLRWNYRGIFSYKFKRRMDQDYGDYAAIAVHAKKYQDLKRLVEEQLESPKALESIRLELSEKLAGKLDGYSSKRIVEYLTQKI